MFYLGGNNITEKVIVENAVISSKGQITIPKEVRDVLGVNYGEKVTFVVINDEVKVVNAAIYAMKVFQTEMLGQANKVDINSEEDVVSLLKKIRSEK